MDMHNYQPGDDVISYVRDVHFVGVVGPTAVGKSTVIDRAVGRDPALHLVRSTTSRTPRPGEEDGVDMHFRAKSEMLTRVAAREYATAIPLFDNIYATAPEDYSAKGVSVMPVIADALPLFSKLPFHDMQVIFVLPPDYDTWLRRFEGRGVPPAQRAKRLQEAVASLQFALTDKQVLFVLNDDLDVAAEEFLLLVHGATPDASQQEACRNLAATLLRRLEADHLS